MTLAVPADANLIFSRPSGAAVDPLPKISATRPSSSYFQLVAWFECTSCWLATSAPLLSTPRASRATHALKTGHGFVGFIAWIQLFPLLGLAAVFPFIAAFDRRRLAL